MVKNRTPKIQFHAIRVPQALMERAMVRREKDLDMRNAGLSMTAVVKVLIAEALMARETRGNQARN